MLLYFDDEIIIENSSHSPEDFLHPECRPNRTEPNQLPGQGAVLEVLHNGRTDLLVANI